MRIGFYMKWPKGSLAGPGNVIGDELYAESMCRILRQRPGVSSAELYAPNATPVGRELDVLVHLNDTPPEPGWARRNVLYLQNAWGEGSDVTLRRLQALGYDGYAFISRRLLEVHQRSGRDGIFLPFGADTSHFRPRTAASSFAYDVAYVGNDIKGEERTRRYIAPALDFRFGLFGNWALPPSGVRFWRRWTRFPSYRRQLAAVTRGRIAQDDVPVLFSSSRIVLNCTASDCVDWDVVTLRTYEVLACGGFLITDRVPVAEKTLSGCVVFTDGGEDLAEKIRYYLLHEADRQAIAARGRAFAVAHASIESRVDELLRYLRSLP